MNRKKNPPRGEAEKLKFNSRNIIVLDPAQFENILKKNIEERTLKVDDAFE